MLFFPGFLVFVITISRIQCEEDGTGIIARLRALEDKVGRQNDIIKLQATQINDLQETVTEQKQSISDLAGKVAAQDIDKKNMMRELREVRNNAIRHERTLKRWMTKVRAVAKGHQINNEGSGYTKKVVGLERLNVVDNARKRFVLDSIETVAFEAIISGATKLPHSHVNDRLVFETVSLNVGSSYHAGNGTFNAPVSGIYVFSTSVMMTTTNTNDPGMHVVIEKNGMEVAGAFAANRGKYEHSSVTAAMELQAGDAVFVSVERHDDLTFYGDKLTSFMGFLLYPF